MFFSTTPDANDPRKVTRRPGFSYTAGSGAIINEVAEHDVGGYIKGGAVFVSVMVFGKADDRAHNGYGCGVIASVDSFNQLPQDFWIVTKVEAVELEFHGGSDLVRVKLFHKRRDLGRPAETNGAVPF